METIKETTQRFKEKAKIFLANNIKTFIEDFSGNYYFCDILEAHQNFVIVKGFGGQRKNQTDRIFFIDIKRLDQYEEKRK